MKGQTRNIETFKVGAGARVNEFDFHKHQEEMQEHHGSEGNATQIRLDIVQETSHVCRGSDGLQCL